ncbi:MAG: hypothetical protein J07AB43_03300 [Candidatus Nanosalina sp. J07AB43]|nr:MAG: hypothetical protein J07AB43_03300 [Candidatus Nanosalina sp. J07AB43]
MNSETRSTVQQSERYSVDFDSVWIVFLYTGCFKTLVSDSKD